MFWVLGPAAISNLNVFLTKANKCKFSLHPLSLLVVKYINLDKRILYYSEIGIALWNLNTAAPKKPPLLGFTT